MNKLTIARYKNGYIRISEYNKSVHKNGEIFCPFCEPQLEVTGVKNDFFRALPDRGGHNCRRRAAEYFNAEWEGRQLIETLSGEEGEVEVIIDINRLGRIGKDLSKIKKPEKPTEDCPQDEFENYNRYTMYKNVLRDVVHTVMQMKNFIEKNSIDNLNKIKFKYKMGTEELSINEVVKLVDEINPSFHKKNRFVIYKVDSVKISNGNIYINSYQTEGVNLATSFTYPSKTNLTGLKKNDFVIAFGTLNYYKPQNQYYLNILSDLNIVKVNDEELTELFASKEMTKKSIEKHSTEKKSFEDVKEDDVQIKNQVKIYSAIDSKHIDSVEHVKNGNNRLESILRHDIEQTILEKNSNMDKKKCSFIKKAVRGLSKLLGK